MNVTVLRRAAGHELYLCSPDDGADAKRSAYASQLVAATGHARRREA